MNLALAFLAVPILVGGIVWAIDLMLGDLRDLADEVARNRRDRAALARYVEARAAGRRWEQ